MSISNNNTYLLGSRSQLGLGGTTGLLHSVLAFLTLLTGVLFDGDQTLLQRGIKRYYALYLHIICIIFVNWLNMKLKNIQTLEVFLLLGKFHMWNLRNLSCLFRQQNFTPPLSEQAYIRSLWIRKNRLKNSQSSDTEPFQKLNQNIWLYRVKQHNENILCYLIITSKYYNSIGIHKCNVWSKIYYVILLSHQSTTIQLEYTSATCEVKYIMFTKVCFYTHTSEAVLGLKLSGVTDIVIDKSEPGSAATTESGAESKGKDRLLWWFIHFWELLSDHVLRYCAATRVHYVHDLHKLWSNKNTLVATYRYKLVKYI